MPVSGIPDIQVGNYDAAANVSSYSRDEGYLVLPVMGPPGTPPKKIRVHAPIGHRTVRWQYAKRGTPPIMPAMANTTSGDEFLGGNLAIPVPSVGGDQNQYDYAASGEYEYIQNVSNAGPRVAEYNVTVEGGDVSGASNTSPIVITTPLPNARTTGDSVTIAGVGGNTAANGTWLITVISYYQFSLVGSVGNGAYTSGGTWNPATYGTPSPRGKFQTGHIPYVTPVLNFRIKGTNVLRTGGNIGGPVKIDPFLEWPEPATAQSADANATQINFNSENYRYYDSTLSSLFFSQSLIL